METIPDIQTVKTAIMNAVSESTNKLTPRDMEKIVIQKLPLSKRKIKTAIRDLISAGDLTYTYLYGCSFLEQSFNKPIRISKKIVLKPLQISYLGNPGEVVVQLLHGASFGTGQHPTTRLALQGIEQALFCGAISGENTAVWALDIGTGSGVLAIAAVLLGAGSAVGIDIDPCARSEAKNNVKINGLSDRIKILNLPLERINEKFSLIIANLRYPTVRKIYPRIRQITEKGSRVVISGIKIQEASDFLDFYTEDTFEVVWRKAEKGWEGIALKRNC